MSIDWKAYKRAYYLRHREHILAASKEYREENKSKIRTWRAANRPKINACSKAWAAANPDKVRAASKKTREKNKDRYAAHQKKYRQDHPDKYAVEIQRAAVLGRRACDTLADSYIRRCLVVNTPGLSCKDIPDSLVKFHKEVLHAKRAIRARGVPAVQH